MLAACLACAAGYGSSKKEVTDHGKKCTFDCSLHIRLYTSADLVHWAFVGTVFNATEIVIDPGLTRLVLEAAPCR